MTEEEAEIPPGGRVVDDPPPWDAWRPEQVTAMLARVDVPWCVAGGWALDLFRGEQTREHGDLEIAIPDTPEAFGAVRTALAGYTFEVIGSGQAWPLDSPAFAVMYQTWVSDPDTGVYRLDVFREPQRDGAWACRRDETITLPYQQAICRTAAGVPYLAPEIALLFKAKHADLDKNQADFAGARPLLSGPALDWLRWTVRQLHPGHQWLAEL